MLDYTKQRHENFRKQIDHKATELKRSGSKNYVEQACKELSTELGYSWRTLYGIYFEYEE